ncbi:MAG: glucose-6-phosphate dehydrogenase (coenzyme-F420) [Mycobacteriales bacterium]
MLRCGYKASAEQFAPGRLLRFAELAEACGFDSVFVSDHLQPWRHSGGHAPAALPWLGALLARTDRVVVGTSVLTPTFRYHPAVVAQAFATLACLAPGRVVLGVGSGESMNEAPLGLAWPEAKERFARLREAVEVIQLLWSAERVSYEGEYYQLKRATLYDRPEAAVPLYVAASGPAAARLAGRVGQGLICTSGKDRALYQDKLLPALAEGAARAGRELADLDRMIEVKVSFDPDLGSAMADTRNWAALALAPEEKTGVEDPVEMQRLAEALPLERAASRWIVSSDPDEHVAAIDEYVQMGFDHLVFHAPGEDQERFLHRYAAEVLPRLRRLN